MVTVGVVLRPQQPPEELEAVVRSADEAGVPELWLWEDCFLEGGLTTATAALARSGAADSGPRDPRLDGAGGAGVDSPMTLLRER